MSKPTTHCSEDQGRASVAVTKRRHQSHPAEHRITANAAQGRFEPRQHVRFQRAVHQRFRTRKATSTHSTCGTTYSTTTTRSDHATHGSRQCERDPEQGHERAA